MFSSIHCPLINCKLANFFLLLFTLVSLSILLWICPRIFYFFIFTFCQFNKSCKVHFNMSESGNKYKCFQLLRFIWLRANQRRICLLLIYISRLRFFRIHVQDHSRVIWIFIYPEAIVCLFFCFERFLLFTLHCTFKQHYRANIE